MAEEPNLGRSRFERPRGKDEDDAEAGDAVGPGSRQPEDQEARWPAHARDGPVELSLEDGELGACRRLGAERSRQGEEQEWCDDGLHVHLRCEAWRT